MKIAILDDYANVALSYGDWSAVEGHAEIVVFNQHLSDASMVERLRPFDVICTLRNRADLTRETISQLPNLKVIVVSDPYVSCIDFSAAAERGIEVLQAEAPSDMPSDPNSTAEFAWGLLLATIRSIPSSVASLQQGQWLHTTGMALEGATLGIVGFGRYGKKIAQYAKAFGMNVIAWSENLNLDETRNAGVRPVDKETLFRESDVVSIHYVLSERSTGLVGTRELRLMKPTAYLINTSRGPIVDEQALVSALKNRQIAGAGLDVFDEEPLPKDHPLLSLSNVVATPHMAYVTEPTMRKFYVGIANAVGAYVKGESLPRLQLSASAHR
jgi:phosphoglycerate dehydrogenase-like enzyme